MKSGGPTGAVAGIWQLQVARSQRAMLSNLRCAFKDVAHLAYVPWPWIARKQLDSGIVQTDFIPSLFMGDTAQNLDGQFRDVLRPLAQGRNANGNDVDAEIKVLAESL